LLGGVLDAMSHLAASRNLQFERRLEPEAVWISGDRSALEKVFFNLLSNAFKFTPPGGRVEVRSRLEDGDLVVEVEDTGIGIGAADLPYVFDRFRQVDNSATRRYSGTGLGLALVKEITERHAGSVFIRSRPNEGTTIGVRLPRLPASDLERLLEKDGTEHPSPNESARWLDLAAQQGAVQPAMTPLPQMEREYVDDPAGERTGTVLIVDDEPDMRRYLVELLAAEYRVLQASDGRQGLELAQARRPDLMVLDLMLPEIDGLEVCRRLKTAAETRGIRIVLLTARADETSKLTALDHGADDFLTKPFSGVEVQTRLRNLLRASLLERDLQQSNTELQAALTDLRETQNRLIHSEKLNALGRLSAGLLHEINNPLNYTLTALDLARNDPAVEGDADLRDTLGDIDEGMQRIKAIVSELRAFAYPSKGDQQPMELTDLVRSALQLTHHDIHDVPVHSDIEPGIRVVASRNHVTQVLVNLLTNASKAVRAAREHRQGEIRLRAELAEERVRVVVRDTGTGIPHELQGRVFDPFYTTRDVGEGMGMGLSVCQTIVRNHGGELSVRSEPGEWTEFVFDLALAEAEAGSLMQEAHEHNA
jgi:signal transduction histidine kinase